MSPTRLIPALAAALLALGGSAGAATSVLDSSSVRACYMAASAQTWSAEAVAGCDAAVENGGLSNKDLAATYANRSVVLLNANQPDAALADADRALTLSPDLKDAAVNKAGALLMLGRYEEARATLDAVLTAITGEALERGLYNRAIASESLGDVSAAYADFKRAAELNPNFEAAHVELARFQVK